MGVSSAYPQMRPDNLPLLLLDELALDKDINLLTDDPFAIEHHVERQAKVLAVDLGLGTVADAVTHHIWVIEFPVLHYLKGNRSGIALDRQVAGHAIGFWPGRFDLRAFEVHCRILVNFQKI